MKGVEAAPNSTESLPVGLVREASSAHRTDSTEPMPEFGRGSLQAPISGLSSSMSEGELRAAYVNSVAQLKVRVCVLYCFTVAHTYLTRPSREGVCDVTWSCTKCGRQVL